MSAALSIRSHFSAKESIIQPSKIGELAKAHGYDAAAIVDFMSINGMVDLTKSCKKAGVKPIVGCRVVIYDDPSFKETKADAKAAVKPNRFWMAKIYAKNEAGVMGLIKLLARANLEDYFYYTARTGLPEVLELLESDNVFLTTGDNYGLFSHSDYTAIADKIFTLKTQKNTFIELVPIDTPLHNKANKRAVDFCYNRAFGRATTHTCQMIVTKPFLYATDDQADSLDVMGAIASNQSIDAMFTPKLYIRNYSFKPHEDLMEAVSDMNKRLFSSSWSFTAALDAPQILADHCTYEWKELPPSLPVMAANESQALIAMVAKGWNERLKKPVLGYQPDKTQIEVYKQRLRYELDVLSRMGFERYFLMVSDIVNWSKKNGIYVGPGRGSAGGSLISYLIGMTDVDPIRFGLLFERFINPERIDLPDVDLDFASSRRHEVIQYIKDRFGEENVAGISNYVTVGTASGIRDISRVFGLEPHEFSCTKLMPKEHGESIDIETSASMVPEIEKFKFAQPVIWRHASQLVGCLRNYGKHAAGVVIAGVPVNQRAVIERRAGEMVVNWDKDSVEKWGLIKVDILGLATLDIFGLATQSIKERKGIEIDLMSVSLDDEKVLAAFGEGKSIGVFQFESGGMRHMLKELAAVTPLTFEDISVATALFRPGPIDAGLMDEFIQYKQGAEIVYLHPKMEPILKDTGGVQIYQEQTQKIAKDICGFSGSESDYLRRAIGKKDKEKMAEMRDKFIEGARAGWVEIELSDEVKKIVHRCTKFKCTDGIDRTVETILEGDFDVINI